MLVGIVVAMESELTPFLAGKSYELIEVKGFAVYKIDIAGKTVYCVRQPHVGIISAAATTQMLISNFSVTLILNFGVVGALTPDISLCSTLLVESVVHYELDTESIDGMPIGKYENFDDVAISTDANLLKIARAISPELPLVRCASGNKFVDNIEDKSRLNSQFGAHICDMESAGILITAKLNDVPCLMVKAVSDSLIGGGDEFSENLGKAARQYVSFVNKILETI